MQTSLAAVLVFGGLHTDSHAIVQGVQTQILDTHSARAAGEERVGGRLRVRPDQMGQLRAGAAQYHVLRQVEAARQPKSPSRKPDYTATFHGDFVQRRLQGCAVVRVVVWCGAHLNDIECSLQPRFVCRRNLQPIDVHPSCITTGAVVCPEFVITGRQVLRYAGIERPHRRFVERQRPRFAIAPQFNYGLCGIECQTSPADPYPASRRGPLPVIGLNPPRLRSIDQALHGPRFRLDTTPIRPRRPVLWYHESQ